MDVLLINPPMCVYEPPRFPSFGIAYVAQELRRQGHRAELIDADSYRYSRETVLERIGQATADVVGIGGLITVFPYLDWLVPQVRRLQPGKPIILGGGLASALGDKCFQYFDVDFLVIGEGEETLVDLLSQIAGAGQFDTVKGIAYRSAEGVRMTEPRPLMASLDDVPRVDASLFPMDRLLENSGGVLQIHAQRGCPFHCTFCFNCYRVSSRAVRYRPVRNVIEEIEFYHSRYKVRLFAIAGECILLNRKWLKEFADEIRRRQLNAAYRVTSRVDTMDAERLGWLRDSGCVVLSVGVESGSQKILDLMQKKATVDEARRAIALAKQYIPSLEVNMMLGYVGETEQTVRESVEFFKEIGVQPCIFFAQPFPGTELYRMALERGRIKDERQYMMGLDRASILDMPRFNFTDMDDETARGVLSAAVREIETYYARQAFRRMTPAVVARRFRESVATVGWKRTMAEGWRLLRHALRHGSGPTR